MNTKITWLLFPLTLAWSPSCFSQITGTNTGVTNASGGVTLSIKVPDPSQVSLTWNSASNAPYNVQWSDFGSNSWQSLSGITTANGSTTTVTDVPAAPCRFYRVVQIQKSVPLKESDSGTAVTLGPGDLLEVALEGNPSTGFAWEISSGTGTVLHAIGTPRYVPSSDIPGAPGTYFFLFEPAATGQTQLKLIYHQPWMKDVPPAKTFEATVTVKPTS